MIIRILPSPFPPARPRTSGTPLRLRFEILIYPFALRHPATPILHPRALSRVFPSSSVPRVPALAFPPMTTPPDMITVDHPAF
jgi:hypothetical protein